MYTPPRDQAKCFFYYDKVVTAYRKWCRDVSRVRKLKTDRTIQSSHSWVADAYNDDEAEFAVSDALAASDVVVIALRSLTIHWTRAPTRQETRLRGKT
jgi:hypothetical protein